MAIGILFDGPGVTQAQYEQTRDEVVPGGQLPRGLLYHAAGPSENGWCVIEVWESQEDATKFFEEQLGAAMQRANINVQPKVFQVHTLLKP